LSSSELRPFWTNQLVPLFLSWICLSADTLCVV
jgi:hypothetical protein